MSYSASSRMTSQVSRACTRIAVRPYLPPPSSRIPSRFASTSSSIPPPPPPRPPTRQRGFYLPLSILVLIPTIYYLRSTSSSSGLSPQVYSDHPLSTSLSLTPSHKLIVVPVDPAELHHFGHPPDTGPPHSIAPDGEKSKEGDPEIVIHHMMIKNPDLQIERPYTPINDVLADGEIRMAIKRVKGGEVGRHVHSLTPPQAIGLRGPIPTLSIKPGDWDKVIMISSGTGVTPFLQLLSKVPEDQESNTRYHLLHATTKSSETDWIESTALGILPRLQQKLGNALRLDRISLDPVDRNALARSIQITQDERVMVLVCLPPHLMRTICGPLTITLGQGELTGVLKDLGLTSSQVWKLE